MKDTTKFFILDAKETFMEVSEKEYEIWMKENAKKYAHEKRFKSNSRHLTLHYLGINMPERERMIFIVSTHICLPNKPHHESTFENRFFDTYQEALKCYEECISLEGEMKSK